MELKRELSLRSAMKERIGQAEWHMERSLIEAKLI